MMIKRKTKSEFMPLRASVRIRIAGNAMPGSADDNPADDVHRFPIKHGELRLSADDNAKYGDQVIPELELRIKGFGTVTLTPNEMHNLLMQIEMVQTRARNAKTYGGEHRAVEVTV
jgi:hypothetical protein